MYLKHVSHYQMKNNLRKILNNCLVCSPTLKVFFPRTIKTALIKCSVLIKHSWIVIKNVKLKYFDTMNILNYKSNGEKRKIYGSNFGNLWILISSWAFRENEVEGHKKESYPKSQNGIPIL